MATQIFFFKIKVVPTSGAEDVEDIAGANVHIRIKEDSLEAAEIKARSFLIDRAYLVERILTVLPMPDLPIPHPETIGQLMFEKSRHEGISIEFVGFPKEARPDNIVEIRSLGPPVIKKV